MNGGYIMVDCGGCNLLALSKQTITGIYDRVKAAYESGKPIYAVNCVYGTGVKLTPIPVFMIKQGTSFCGSSSILQMWVGDDDGVTIENLITAKTTKGETK